MRAGHHFLPELRHATVPTYIVSYIFPLTLAAYEIYRVVYWVVHHGWRFAELSQAGFEFTLMLVIFAMQIIIDALFFVVAWIGKHPDIEHRLSNMTLGVLCSAAVLAFDVWLQLAF